MSKTLKDLQAEVLEVNTANGWHDTDRSFGDGMALLHSEVSEAFEAYRDHGVGDFTRVQMVSGSQPDSEVRDIIAGLLARQDAAYFAARPDGFSPSTYFSPDELMTLARHGVGKPEGVGSEFADILIRLLDECERQGVDLDYEVERKLAYNRTRGHRHGGKRV